MIRTNSKLNDVLDRILPAGSKSFFVRSSPQVLTGRHLTRFKIRLQGLFEEGAQLLLKRG